MDKQNVTIRSVGSTHLQGAVLALLLLQLMFATPAIAHSKGYLCLFHGNFFKIIFMNLLQTYMLTNILLQCCHFFVKGQQRIKEEKS